MALSSLNVGYVELDVDIMGIHLTNVRVLIQKDALESHQAKHIPGLIGMNLLRKIPEVTNFLKTMGAKDINMTKKGKANSQFIKVAGKCPIRIPAESVSFVFKPTLFNL